MLTLPSLSDLTHRARRSYYLTRPADWVLDRCGEHLWSKQAEIANSVVAHRKTAVPSSFATGKALADSTPISTPGGWTPISSLSPGSIVHAHDGTPSRVLAVHPQGPRQLYTVRLRDGAEIEADADHLWAVKVKGVRNGKYALVDRLMTTTEIYHRYQTYHPVNRKVAIPHISAPIQHHTQHQPLHPYLVGVLLGDGNWTTATLVLSLGDPCIADKLTSLGYTLNKRKDPYAWSVLNISALGDEIGLRWVHGLDKSIPANYLYADPAQRLHLLQGLMDTDGSTDGRTAEYTSSSRQLATDVLTLIRSFGIYASTRVRPTTHQDSYRIYIEPCDIELFTVKRKADRWAKATRRHKSHRWIADISPSRIGNATCITIDHPSSLFVADHHIVTHNSFVASRLVAWWIDSHEPGEAFVVSTAATAAQVRAILWRELGRAHEKAHLPGRMNQTEWWLSTPKGREELVAFGRKPSDLNMASFQGIHAPYVLVIIDEAAGVSPMIFDGAEALATSDDCRILAIGNPEDNSSEFARVCQPGSGWNVIPIPAFSTPNFTGEPVPEVVAKQLVSKVWVEEKRAKWGEDNPAWQSKVLAQFPDTNEFGLIPVSWLKAAQLRTIIPSPDQPLHLGVDVGGGGDKSTQAANHGGRVRIIRSDNEPNTMQTLNNVKYEVRRLEPAEIRVDMIGIGRGVVDRLKIDKDHAGRKFPVQGINVSEQANDPDQFINLRAEGYWRLREYFQDGLIDIDPNDDDLYAQLAGLRYYRVRGRIGIEDKDSIRRRTGRSPDEADAIMLAVMDLPRDKKKRKRGGTWGKSPAHRPRVY